MQIYGVSISSFLCSSSSYPHFYIVPFINTPSSAFWLPVNAALFFYVKGKREERQWSCGFTQQQSHRM